MIMTKMVVGVCGDAGGSGDVDVNDGDVNYVNDDDGFIGCKIFERMHQIILKQQVDFPSKKKINTPGTQKHKNQGPNCSFSKDSHL